MNITVAVYTVGGVDENGNEIEEPIVFDGTYKEAIQFFNNENNIRMIDKIFYNMPDGYIMVETDRYTREVYDAEEIMNTINDMFY